MIRDYQENDKNTLLELVRLNVPKYFDPTEVDEFLTYLNDQREIYIVYDVKDQGVLGAGGINLRDDGKTGIISWDFVHPEFHGKGIGGQLLEHRLRILNEEIKVEKIVVRTAQFTYKYYEKFGFKLMRIEEDFWAEGYHLYYMEFQN